MKPIQIRKISNHLHLTLHNGAIHQGREFSPTILLDICRSEGIHTEYKLLSTDGHKMIIQGKSILLPLGSLTTLNELASFLDTTVRKIVDEALQSSEVITIPSETTPPTLELTFEEAQNLLAHTFAVSKDDGTYIFNKRASNKHKIVISHDAFDPSHYPKRLNTTVTLTGSALQLTDKNKVKDTWTLLTPFTPKPEHLKS